MPQRPDDDEVSFVRNASDRKQLRAAKKVGKEEEKLQEADLRKVLSLPEGRRLLWRILKTCHVFESIWHPSALIHYQAGQQDLGHQLMVWINEISPDMLTEIYQMYRTSTKENEE
jgi:hypothetical protein